MIARAVTLAAALAGGLVSSQLPEFAQQYRQRLGGAVDELARILAEFDAQAGALSLNREQGIARMRANADELVRRQGSSMLENSARHARLKQQIDDFGAAGSLSRIGLMLRDMDTQIARGALRVFEPAVPLTSEGAITAAAGAAGGWALLRLVLWPFRRRPGRTAKAQA